MFGFGKKQNYLKEYGFEELSLEKGISFLDVSMKMSSHHCYTAFKQNTGNGAPDSEFLGYLNLAAAFNTHAYFVKEVRRKLRENNCSEVQDLPDLAIAQLNAMNIILTCMSAENGKNPLKPTTTRALTEIDYYVSVARNIVEEAERVKAHDAAKSVANVRSYQNEQQQVWEKVKRIPYGEISSQKISALEALTHQDINFLMCDSEADFEDVEALVWIFSRPDCEIGNVLAFIEMWEVAEPCLAVTQEENHSYIRVNLFPVYETITEGLNTLRIRKNELPFTKAAFKHLEAMINSQKELTASGKTILYPLNPQILFHYQQLVD